eukprot:gene10713-7444_t
MAAPVLDFYAPAPDHRRTNKEKLSRQRDALYSWRADHQKTTFDPKTGARKPILNSYEMAPKQVIMPGSQREAALLHKKRQQEETIWDFASGTPCDRRREWRATGFTFDAEHFRTSDDPRSKYYPKNKPPITASSLRAKQRAIQTNPYKPYYHDAILLSCPPAGSEVTCLAVTYNKAEAVQRELHAAKASRQARLMRKEPGEEDPAPASWCEALGPAISAKQRNMELAEHMYQDLVCRQAALTDTEVGSPESLDIQIPTSEIAYSLRAEYLKKHSTNHPGATQGERSAGQGTSASPESGSGEPVTMGNGSRRAPGMRQHFLPAEAKSTRLYAIALRRYFCNEESSMTQRQEPVRQGVAVDLPASWQSPLMNGT